MERYLSLTVAAEQDGCTVGHLLKTACRVPGGMIASLKRREAGICLNGARVHTNIRVRRGDVLRVRLDVPGETNPAEPAEIPLVIPYEDADLAVLEKPAGLLVHGTPDGKPTLMNALAARWGKEQPVYPVHRLDRGTSGLLVVAKNPYAAERLRRALHTERFVRDYLALAAGTPPERSGWIDAPVGPMDGEGPRYGLRPDGRPARTRYEMICSLRGGCLLRLRLDTGRTHQIRVHLASIGCPLFGDRLYGGPELPGLDRPALHAAHLALEQPVTGERLELCSPLPEELRTILRARGGEEKEETTVWR